jgi:LEA14-like dessication related protein
MSMLRAFSSKCLLVLLVGLWLTGCTSTEKAGIVVSIVKVSATEVALTDRKVVLQLRLVNENLMPIALARTVHKVYLNGIYFGEAVGTKPLALMERGDVRYEVTLTLADAAAAARLREMLLRGAVNYRLESRMLCDAAGEDLYMLSTDSGQLPSR